MKILSVLLLLMVAALTGCGSANENKSNNANMRGMNTNTGYTTNSETNAIPKMPANPTNITPGNITGDNHNSKSNSNMHSNSNTKGEKK